MLARRSGYRWKVLGGGFARHFGTATHRNAYVGGGECGCVVDAVAHHPHAAVCCADSFYDDCLAARQDAAECLVQRDADSVRDGVHHLLAITRDDP